MTETDGLRWIRLVFVDVFGAAHAVTSPAAHFTDALEKGVPFDGSALAGRARHFEEDMVLRPDPATLLATSSSSSTNPGQSSAPTASDLSSRLRLQQALLGGAGCGTPPW